MTCGGFKVAYDVRWIPCNHSGRVQRVSDLVCLFFGLSRRADWKVGLEQCLLLSGITLYFRRASSLRVIQSTRSEATEKEKILICFQ